MAELTDKRPTSSKHYVLALLDHAERKGFSPQELLLDCGLSPEEVATGRRVDTYKLAQLVQLIWGKLQDENLGCSEHPCKPGVFYLMGRLTVHEPILEKALRLGIHFYQQFVTDYTLGLEVDGDVASFTLEQRNPHLDPHHLLTELILIAWHRYCSWLINRDIPLIEASFVYAPPKHVDEYKFLLPSQHHFNAQKTSFSFNSRYLKYEVVQNVETLKGFMARCPAYLFLTHKGEKTLKNRIRMQLEKQIVNGLPNIEDVATHLNITPQTLRRRLKQEGTSYQRIKDMVRRDMALYHLTQKYTPVYEVAHLIGFSEPSVFIRAFKEWTGVTPTEFRNNLQ